MLDAQYVQIKENFDFFFIFTIDEFAPPHIEYANSICWLKGSYYLPTEESMFVKISFFSMRISMISYNS